MVDERLKHIVWYLQVIVLSCIQMVLLLMVTLIDHCIDRRAKRGNPKCGTNCIKSNGGKFDNVIALEVQDCRSIIIIMYIVYCVLYFQ